MKLGEGLFFVRIVEQGTNLFEAVQFQTERQGAPCGERFLVAAARRGH
jgi:hypothetical protein